MANVVATQRLGYLILGTGWSLEEAGHESALEMSAALFPNGSFDETKLMLTEIGMAIRDGRKPVLSSQLPPFLKRDLQTLADSVASRNNGVAADADTTLRAPWARAFSAREQNVGSIPMSSVAAAHERHPTPKYNSGARP